MSELAGEHFSLELTRPTFKMHSLRSFTTQPESQSTKRRKQAPLGRWLQTRVHRTQ